MVHRGGDMRGNYTDFVMLDMSFSELFELEGCTNCVVIDGRYMVDVVIWREGYKVYDSIKEEDIGDFYDIDKADLIESIQQEVGNEE